MVRQDSPVFNELKSMMVKTTGLAGVVRHSLDNLSDHIKIALLYGSVAGGTFTADSDIDLLVVGEAGFSKVAQALSEAQDKLGREINPSVYGETELREKLRSGNHFVSSVMDGPKIFLIGGEDELARLAG
jgi:predicted nucleotidyltransferase